MLMLLFIPIFYAVACAHRYLQLYAPSNLLIARVRLSPPRWGTAMILMALAYALIWAAHYLTLAIWNGAPGWLNLIVVVLAWDAIKFTTMAIAVGMHRILIALRGCITHSSNWVTTYHWRRVRRPLPLRR